jgi:hypothetical protein
MTTTPEVPALAPVVPVANPRNRRRRLRLFAPVFLFLAFLAYGSLAMPWYAASQSSSTVDGLTHVSAHATLTGDQMAKLTDNVNPIQGLANANPAAKPTESTHLGIIAPVFWLLVALGLGAICALLESTAAGVIGAVVAGYAWMLLIALRQTFENPSTLGSYLLERGAGQQRFFFVLTLGVFMLLLVAVQSFMAHHDERALHRALHPNEPTMVANLVAGLARKVGVNINQPSDTTAVHDSLSGSGPGV